MPITSTQYVPPSLVDPYLKTARAKEHLDALRSEIDIFHKAKPYSFFPEDDVQHGLYRVRVQMDEVPNRVPLIVGDLFCCLRSSLDQLVFSLAKLTTPNPKGTQFPILDTWDRKSRNRFSQQTHGVPADARAIIESLQPCHGPNTASIRSRLLWQLNAICNVDKHRRIPVNSCGITFRFPNVPASVAAFVKFEQGDVVAVPLRFKSQMALDPVVTYEIVFGDMSSGIECDIDGVDRIYDFVANNVIPRFTSFFQ